MTTPATASSWRWQVHRRVQLHRPRTTEIQTKLASIKDNSLTICYQNSPCCVTSYRDRVSPRQASYLSCSHKKRNPKNATRLSASLRYVSLRSGQTCVTPFSLRCRPTRFALAARRSDKQRQVRARCIDTLRCQCPQPEQRAAGADTRVEAGADSRLDL